MDAVLYEGYSEEELKYVNPTPENIFHFAEFMQSRQARRFTRKFGFPVELMFVRHEDFFHFDYTLHAGIFGFKRDYFDTFTKLQGNYVKVSERNPTALAGG